MIFSKKLKLLMLFFSLVLNYDIFTHAHGCGCNNYQYQDQSAVSCGHYHGGSCNHTTTCLWSKPIVAGMLVVIIVSLCLFLKSASPSESDSSMPDEVPLLDKDYFQSSKTRWTDLSYFTDKLTVEQSDESELGYLLSLSKQKNASNKELHQPKQQNNSEVEKKKDEGHPINCICCKHKK